MSSRTHQLILRCAVAGSLALTALNVSAQTFEQEFTWLGQSLIVPDACFDENWRFIRITHENSETCWRLSPAMVEAFNTAVSDPENHPVPVHVGGAVAPSLTVYVSDGELTLR